MVIGYTTGVFDLFHIGHLNILKQAKSMCDKLIVGVTTDEYVKKYKNSSPSIPYAERAEIVRSIKFVDSVIPQLDHNKFEAWKKLKFDLIFVGDDWKGSDLWNNLEDELSKVGSKVVYFKYTSGTSTTEVKRIIKNN